MNDNTLILLTSAICGLTLTIALIVVARNSKARYKAMSNLIEFWSNEIKNHRKLAVKENDKLINEFNVLNEKFAFLDIQYRSLASKPSVPSVQPIEKYIEKDWLHKLQPKELPTKQPKRAPQKRSTKKITKSKSTNKTK